MSSASPSAVLLLGMLKYSFKLQPTTLNSGWHFQLSSSGFLQYLKSHGWNYPDISACVIQRWSRFCCENRIMLFNIFYSIYSLNVFLPCHTSSQALFCSCPRAHGCFQLTCPAHFQDVEAGQSGSHENKIKTINEKPHMSFNIWIA